MTADTPAALTIVAFGDLDAGVWGVAWGARETAFLLRVQETELAGTVGIERGDDDWTLAGDGLELTVSGLGEAVPHEGLGGFDQLCRITGTAAGATIQGLARRGARSAVDLEEVESVRDVSCWFEPDRGLALTAVRPRRSRGHDADVLAAAVLDVEAAHPVAEPRLSTTYSLDGHPARAGLELWLDDEEDTEQHYPTRAAGERHGTGMSGSLDGLELMAEPFAWHSRGAHGTGAYLLMRRR